MADYPGSGITIVSGTDTHGDVLAELQAVALIPPMTAPYVAGKWSSPPFMGLGSAQIYVEGQIHLLWHPVPFGKVIASVAEEVTVVGTTGAVRRLMLYTHNVTTGLPDALLEDLGTYDAVTSTGSKVINTTTSPAVANYGGVWTAAVTQGAAGTRPTIRSTNGHSAGVLLASANVTTNIAGWGTNATTHTGAAPANIGAVSIAGNVPRHSLTIA